MGAAKLNEPLTVRVESARVQPKINPLQLPLYEGRTDLKTHLSKLRIYMTGCGASDATRCRMFPLTLGNLAHRWYVSLPSRSIDSFDVLATTFTSYFAAKVVRLEDPHCLMKIRQGKKETDEAYIDRMYEAVLTGEPTSDELALHAVLGWAKLATHISTVIISFFLVRQREAAENMQRANVFTSWTLARV
ncbi:hypothetical protein OROGR_012599 [Orobanche gracilis]